MLGVLFLAIRTASAGVLGISLSYPNNSGAKRSLKSTAVMVEIDLVVVTRAIAPPSLFQ